MRGHVREERGSSARERWKFQERGRLRRKINVFWRLEEAPLRLELSMFNRMAITFF